MRTPLLAIAFPLLLLWASGCTINTGSADPEQLTAVFVPDTPPPVPSIVLLDGRRCCGELSVVSTTDHIDEALASVRYTLWYSPDQLSFLSIGGWVAEAHASEPSPGQLVVEVTRLDYPEFGTAHSLIFRAERQGTSIMRVTDVHAFTEAGEEIPGVAGVGGSVIVRRESGDL